MNIPDETSRPSPPRRWLLLLGLPVLAALLWAGTAGWHRPAQWRQALTEFRGEAAPDAGPNRAMSDVLQARQFLQLHPRTPFSLIQSARLVGFINSPVDEQSQSEALDVLSMAQRSNALPPGQARKAQQATLLVLSRSPGPMVRLESARFLGHLGDISSVPALTILSGDADPKVREAAGEALKRVQM